MNLELMSLIKSVLPFLQQRQAAWNAGNAGFVAPGTEGAPNVSDIGTAFAGNPALRGLSPDMVTGVGQPTGTFNPALGMALGRMGQEAMGRTGGGSDYSGERPERFVRGQPQGMPPKIGNPQTDFQMTNMQNPVASVGQFLLSPAGQQIIRALQGIGA